MANPIAAQKIPQDECDPSGDSRQLLFSCFGVNNGTKAEHWYEVSLGIHAGPL